MAKYRKLGRTADQRKTYYTMEELLQLKQKQKKFVKLLMV